MKSFILIVAAVLTMVASKTNSNAQDTTMFANGKFPVGWYAKGLEAKNIICWWNVWTPMGADGDINDSNCIVISVNKGDGGKVSCTVEHYYILILRDGEHAWHLGYNFETVYDSTRVVSSKSLDQTKEFNHLPTRDELRTLFTYWGCLYDTLGLITVSGMDRELWQKLLGWSPDRRLFFK